MRVSLNLQPVEIPAGCATLAEIVFFVEQQRLEPGVVITRIMLNGEDLSDEREEELAGQPVAAIEFLEFYTARVDELANAGLEDAQQLLPGLADDLPAVARELRSGNVAEGLVMFERCIEVLGWYVSLVTAIDTIFRRQDPGFRLDPARSHSTDEAAADMDLTGALATEGENLNTFASIEILQAKLRDIERSQSANDHLLLADLLEYELQPIVALWIPEVPVLLGKIRRERGQA